MLWLIGGPVAAFSIGDEVDALRHWCDSVVDGLRHYEGGGELEEKLLEKDRIFAKLIKNR